MSRLATYYLKLDVEIPFAEQELSRAHLNDLVKPLASAIYRQDTEVEIYFRQGSLEVWVVIAGSIYLAIGNYGSFRTGLNQIIDDAKALKQLLVSSIRKDGVAEDAVLKEKRLNATPDRVRRLLRRIDRYERELPELAENEARAKLARLLRAVQDLTAEMEFKEDIELLMQNLDERFLPQPRAIQEACRKSVSFEEKTTFLQPARREAPNSYHPKLPPPDWR